MTERWRSGLVLVLSAVLFVVVLLVGPSSEVSALRRLVGLGDDPLGRPADVVPGGVHAFLETQPGRPDEPVTWDPCREVVFQVNPDGAPVGDDEAVDFVREGVAQVAAVTGLRFRYDGRTGRRPDHDPDRVPLRRAEPVLIAWADEDEVERLEGDVAGIGGASAQSGGGSDGRLWFVTGAVTLDEDFFARAQGSRGGAAQQRAVLLHELGHLVGLAHVGSPAELMYADSVGLVDFGQGDLTGLARLGRGTCR